jgi:signal transduction histidine kinase
VTPPALAEIAAGWPLAASLAAVTAGGVRAGRRRTALNEALHELRRPLQALALTAPAEPGTQPALEGPLQMAATALERLEREVNGEPAVAVAVPLRVGPLLEAAVGRWRARAALAGGSLRLGGHVEAAVRGDGRTLAEALDNLIVNAIEHGGPEVVVGATRAGARLRIAVRDSGRGSPPRRRPTPAGPFARLSSRRRRGHGLRVVRRTAAAHGGEFALRRARAEGETVATLELPLHEAPEGA